MNLNYIFNEFQDPMYITNQHKLINKVLDKRKTPFTFNKEFFKTPKINIGIISGDFVDHPVCYFIITFLKHFDSNKFNVTCYSEAVIATDLYNPLLQFKLIKHLSQEQASNIVFQDNIHILLDLTGHTALNRLDIFAFKPAPIQISYIGYPFTTGLNEMDYRITDNICDGDLSISQKFYTEKLITLDNCFLCYDPLITLPTLKDTPRLTNPNQLLIACFNRINKITESVIKEFNNILLECPNVKFVFKTKALINITIQKDFINKFHNSVQQRIIILDCTLSHTQHINIYNQVDLAIDTFPYSGTTTSCEALSMGVPVFSIWDRTNWFHPTNVTVSILKNSGLDFFICDNTNDIILKIKSLENENTSFWKSLKFNTKNSFLNGFVCDKLTYISNIQKLFTNLFNQ